MTRPVTVECEACGGEGRIFKSRYGGNDPDVWDAGLCPTSATAQRALRSHQNRLMRTTCHERSGTAIWN